MPDSFMVWVLVVIVAIIGVGVVVGLFQRRALKERTRGFAQLAQSHGWRFPDNDPRSLGRYSGEPFTRGGRVRHIVTGQHRGREFTTFAYHYVTSRYTGMIITRKAHHFRVWTIKLPAPVPEFAVGREGVLGGKVAEKLGFERIDTGDPQFDSDFKVTSDDHQFARRVLHPELIDLLKRTGPWEWRFTGQTMIAYQKGIFRPQELLPRLELMSDVLDRIPADVWGSTRS